MATESDRQEERDRLGNDPLEAPPAEQLEEENPVESPAADEEADAEPEHDSPEERASMIMETGGQVAKSTEGLTVGGTDKTPMPEVEGAAEAAPSVARATIQLLGIRDRERR